MLEHLECRLQPLPPACKNSYSQFITLEGVRYGLPELSFSLSFVPPFQRLASASQRAAGAEPQSADPLRKE